MRRRRLDFSILRVLAVENAKNVEKLTIVVRSSGEQEFVSETITTCSTGRFVFNADFPIRCYESKQVVTVSVYSKQKLLGEVHVDSCIDASARAPVKKYRVGAEDAVLALALLPTLPYVPLHTKGYTRMNATVDEAVTALREQDSDTSINNMMALCADNALARRYLIQRLADSDNSFFCCSPVLLNDLAWCIRTVTGMALTHKDFETVLHVLAVLPRFRSNTRPTRFLLTDFLRCGDSAIVRAFRPSSDVPAEQCKLLWSSLYQRLKAFDERKFLALTCWMALTGAPIRRVFLPFLACVDKKLLRDATCVKRVKRVYTALQHKYKPIMSEDGNDEIAMLSHFVVHGNVDSNNEGENKHKDAASAAGDNDDSDCSHGDDKFHVIVHCCGGVATAEFDLHGKWNERHLLDDGKGEPWTSLQRLPSSVSETLAIQENVTGESTQLIENMRHFGQCVLLTPDLYQTRFSGVQNGSGGQSGSSSGDSNSNSSSAKSEEGSSPRADTDDIVFDDLTKRKTNGLADSLPSKATAAISTTESTEQSHDSSHHHPRKDAILTGTLRITEYRLLWTRPLPHSFAVQRSSLLETPQIRVEVPVHSIVSATLQPAHKILNGELRSILTNTRHNRNGPAETLLTGTALELECKNLRRLVFVLPHPTEICQALVARVRELAFPGRFRTASLFAFRAEASLNDQYANNLGKDSKDSDLRPECIFDAEREFRRQGALKPDSNWAISEVNRSYAACASYPEYLVLPREIAHRHDTLLQVSKFRSKGRVPALTYFCEHSCSSLLRSSQPLVGLGFASAFGLSTSRCKADEQLLRLARVQHILDARPLINAQANRAAGGGFENVTHYDGVRIQFCGVENIHAVRNALNTLGEEDDSQPWCQLLETVLDASYKVAELLHKGESVLVHCSDGWDRTAQMCALTQLVLDNYSRTLRGFLTLIEKDWVQFGHRFATRLGHGVPPCAEDKAPLDQRSPVFLQFLDCVWQIWRQHPDAFEFDESVLECLAKHSVSCLFGTFLCDNEKEREQCGVRLKTKSVYEYILSNEVRFSNALYRPQRGHFLLRLRPHVEMGTWPYLLRQSVPLSHTLHASRRRVHRALALREAALSECTRQLCEQQEENRRLQAELRQLRRQVRVADACRSSPDTGETDASTTTMTATQATVALSPTEAPQSRLAQSPVRYVEEDEFDFVRHV
ncbi:MAG: hypothetical protein MHM6MM_004759 [Cercozoa sp. M6MM]